MKKRKAIPQPPIGTPVLHKLYGRIGIVAGYAGRDVEVDYAPDMNNLRHYGRCLWFIENIELSTEAEFNAQEARLKLAQQKQRRLMEAATMRGYRARLRDEEKARAEAHRSQ